MLLLQAPAFGLMDRPFLSLFLDRRAARLLYYINLVFWLVAWLAGAACLGSSSLCLYVCLFCWARPSARVRPFEDRSNLFSSGWALFCSFGPGHGLASHWPIMSVRAERGRVTFVTAAIIWPTRTGNSTHTTDNTCNFCPWGR